MPYVDFADLKERVSISQLIPLLGINFIKKGDNWRAPCPHCKAGGPRTLSITEGRGFQCFNSSARGDIIALVSHIRNVSPTEAAKIISALTGTVPVTKKGTVPSTVPPAPRSAVTFDPDKYFRELNPEHELVSALGISKETCEIFQCGYSGKAGLNYGRLAVRVDDMNGNFLCFVGVPGTSEEALTHPKTFNPLHVLFNAHRVRDGEARMVGNVLDVLLAYEHTGEMCICFLTDLVSSEQHTVLTSAQDKLDFKVFY